MRRIPEQFQHFYTPEQLAARDKIIADANAFPASSLHDAHQRTLYDGLVARLDEYRTACIELKRLEEQVAVEGLATVKASGLEYTLSQNEEGEEGIILVEQLLQYATQPTQRQYENMLREATVILAAYTILYESLKEF